MEAGMRYGEFVFSRGYISKEELETALDRQKSAREDGIEYSQLGNMFVSLQMMTEEKVCATLSEFHKHKVQYKPIMDLRPTKEVANLVDGETLNKYKCIVLGIDNEAKVIKIGTISEKETEVNYAQSNIREKRFGYKLEVFRVLESSYFKFYKRILKLQGKDISTFNEISVSTSDKLAQIYRDAIKLHASDIHIDTLQDSVRINFRVATILQPYKKVEFPYADRDRIWRRILAAAKVQLDEIAKGMVDTSIGDLLNDDKYSARINIQRIITGYGITYRLIEKNQKIVTLNELGLTPQYTAFLKRVAKYSKGLVLITGPMGSGKNTTIYSVLNELNDGTKHIVSIEDPVEKRLNGINQIPIDSRKVTFSEVAKSVVRQDVNVLFIGETRDEDSVILSIDNAIAGMLVKSTLHISNLQQVIGRLEALYPNCRYKAIQALSAVATQTMVRKICPHCKREVRREELSSEEQFVLEKIKLSPKIKTYKGQGCKYCEQTGYAMYTEESPVIPVSVVGEYLEFDINVKRELQKCKDAVEMEVVLEKTLRANRSTMLHDGLIKLHNGVTDVAELIRHQII